MNFKGPDLVDLVDLDDWITINLALAESRLDIPVKKHQKHYEQLELKDRTVSDGVINRLVSRGYSEAGDQWTKIRENYRQGKLTRAKLADTYLDIKEAIK